MSKLLAPWLLAGVATVGFIAAPAPAASYKQTNLVSDQPGLAPIVDANLKNPWGLALSSAGGNLWVSNQLTGTATIYAGGVAGSPFTAIRSSCRFRGEATRPVWCSAAIKTSR